MMTPISFFGWVDVEDTETMLREQIHAQQAEIKALRTALMYVHPAKEQYKFGVDWSKDGNAVTVLKVYEGGVAEVVFTDYQEVTHPVNTCKHGVDDGACKECYQEATQPAKTLTDDFIYKNHMGYVSPTGNFYAPDYPTWKQDGFVPIYKEPVVKELTDGEILQANLEFGKENGEDYSMLTIEDIQFLTGLVKFILRKSQEK